MTQSERLAALHATSFSGHSRWSQAAFQAALDDPNCFFAFAPDEQDGFALGRIAADEAELLTLVVAKGARRKGTGRHLLHQFEHLARLRGAKAAFLEVSVENNAAIALYRAGGWSEAGLRSGYYGGTDALVLRKDL